MKSSFLRDLTLVVSFAFAQISRADGGPVANVGGPIAPVVIELAEDGAPKSLPIASMTVLKAFAEESVTDSWISMWAMSLINDDDSHTYFQLQRQPGESPNAFAARTLEQDFSFKLQDHRDPVNVSASMWMKWKGTYYPVFHGGASTHVMDLPGGGTGFNMPKLNVQMANTIYIPVGSMFAASLVMRDEFGNYQYGISLNVRNGLLEFPTQYAKTEGLVTGWTRGNDGRISDVAYDKSNNGGRVSPLHVTGTTRGFLDNSFEASVQAHPNAINYVFMNGIVKWGNTPPVLRLEVKPSATGDHAAEMRIVSAIVDERNVYVSGPTFATLLRAGDTPDKVQYIPVENNTLKVTLSPGVWSIGMENPEIWSQYRPQPSYHDGERGGSAEALGTSATLEGADAAAAETP